MVRSGANGAMAVLVAMLFERYQAGKYPLALVSMDNCSRNGEKLRESVLTMAEEWQKKGFVDADFLAYVSDEQTVAFPWTMIDKITPRPSEQIAADLEKLGVENMQPVITGKKTYIAPFVNAEKPQYLVIEDSFPNGRPALGERVWCLSCRQKHGQPVRKNESNGMSESGTFRDRPVWEWCLDMICLHTC